MKNASIDPVRSLPELRASAQPTAELRLRDSAQSAGGPPLRDSAQSVLSFADVEAARRRLAGGLRVTSCNFASSLSEICGMSIWLKRDDLQRTGSFKERGARHALLLLTEGQRRAGVVAASAGNHALGLAFHGGQLGVPVTVIVPATAPQVKIARCRALGAHVVVHGAGFEDAQRYAVEWAAQTGAAVVHPFDDPAVMAGQGTLALEVLEQVPEFDAIAIPVGGGGLLAGVATAIKAIRPRARVIAVEPANAASFLAAELWGRPTRAPVLPTLADGLAVASVGPRAFATAQSLVDDVVTVSEDEIGTAIALLAREAGAVIEGAGATALAAVVAGKVQARSVVVPLTGRNIDMRVHADLVAAATAARSGSALAAAA